ncbi:MAG: prenyltransferase/squalene oxidase repeat-containing protein [Verrucomicrobiales bacterium]
MKESKAEMLKQVEETLSKAQEHLLARRNAAGHWEGTLSSSALSTATAIVALQLIDPHQHGNAVQRGLQWLRLHQNEDGGFGDTTSSFSNLSTSMLCWAAFGLCRTSESRESERTSRWIERHCGSLQPGVLAEKVAALYGQDRTFSVPIVMTCAIGGRLGTPAEAWRLVMPLPFELAALPQKTFARLRLPVVSYALPALIAIGQARFHHAPPKPPLRWLRHAAVARTRRRLNKIQPASGGYLEATPLTSFVAMALASCGWKNDPTVRTAEKFLVSSQRPDGSWPIDTNLATWVTTLSVKALGGRFPGAEVVRDWLLGQQYQAVHPYTDSPPGGWAWTNLTGGVPDADDTAGALVALKHLAPGEVSAASRAVKWLLDLQNRDGGIPTFCRGWGALPFDRSAPDLTAHAIRAWVGWMSSLDAKTRGQINHARDRAMIYLKAQQQPDGAWLPLWFGNQHRHDETNPTYGTAMVCLALPPHDPMRLRGVDWLLRNQQPDGGWGGGISTPSSIEETSLALSALATEGDCHALRRGIRWLIEHTENGTFFPPAPIGFYFARLWYCEDLYPVIWAVGALQAARKQLGHR